MPRLSGDGDVAIEITSDADVGGIDQAQKKLVGFSDAATSASKQLALGLGVASAALGAAGLGAVKLSADMEQSKVAFKTLLGSAEKANDFLNQLKKDAAATPFELKGLTDMSQRLIGSGISAEKARETVLQLGDALSATGAGSAEMLRIGNTISQVFGKGKADAVDFKEIVNAGWVSVKKDVADVMGFTMTQLEDAVSNGEVGFEDLSKTLKKVTGEGGKYFGAMADQSKTVTGTFSTLKDTVSLVMVDIGDKIVKAFDLSGPEGNIAKLTAAVQSFGDYFVGTVIPVLENNKGIFVALGATILTLLTPAFYAWATAIGVAAGALLAATWPVLALIAVGTALYLAWNNNFLGIRDIVMGLVDFFLTSVLPVLTGVFNAITIAVLALYNIFNFYFQVIRALVTIAVDYIANTALSKTLVGGFNFVSTKLGELKASWDKIWAGISDTVTGVASSVVNKVKGMIEAVKGFINDLISKANNVGKVIPGYIQIPAFADGVSNFSGGTALVGERGPELVNLPRGSDVIPNDQLGGLGKAVTINQTNNIYGNIDLEQSLRDMVFAVQMA